LGADVVAATIDAALADALREVFDPELGVNVVDLGLVYEATVDGGVARVRLAMTSPTCPLGDMIARDVEAAIRRHLPGVSVVDVQIVDEPAWPPERMSDAARALLGWS
jgi:metal-sulfur cluster biosynthetic enzyme